METARVLLEGYGYWLLLGVGFAEFAGLPIASVPVLIVAGAAAAEGALSLPAAALMAAAGGLTADAGWFALSRWRGQRLVDTVCNLSSNPRSCVITIAGRVEMIGPALVLPSKFVPGTGNLVAASAGLTRLRPVVFLASDTVALALWATAYLGTRLRAGGTSRLRRELGGWIHRYRGDRSGCPNPGRYRLAIRARRHASGGAPASAGAAGPIRPDHGARRGRGLGAPDWTKDPLWA